MKSHFKVFALALAMVTAIQVSMPRNAHALSADTRSILVGGTYGVLGGAALGLISWPLTQNPRSIALGASIGLYLGLIAGIYYIHNRDNPQNPLAYTPAYDAEYELARLSPIQIEGAKQAQAKQVSTIIEVQMPVARF
jgi:hypothetical protein